MTRTNSTGMRFGLFGSAPAPRDARDPAQGFRDYVDTNVEAEALGFQSSFLVEHHFTGHGQVSASLALQSFVAARTTTLRIGTAVLVLPWHNPVLLAEQAATLDLMSGGRLDFGVGKGYRRNEFDGFCVPIEEAEARFEEALAVIIRAWTADAPFSHHGRWWRFADIVVEPPTAQKPHPPLWMAAGSEASIRRVAALGANLLLDQFGSPEQIAARIKLYRDAREARGDVVDPLSVALARDVYVALDAAELDQARAMQARAHGQMVALSRHADDRHRSHILSYVDRPGGTQAQALFGTPDQVVAQLRALHAVGVRYVLVNGGRAQRETLRRLAQHVMPHFVG
jgi:alkanesulfonate monooxygenase SsuD/methylene tetrahydromethanopterin reductase-like flavin-dependent oxidoreductase (luciferase family)